MIKKEKQAHIFSVPIYLFKKIMGSLFYKSITPTKVTHFEDLSSEIVDVEFGSEITINHFKPINFDQIYNSVRYLFLINNKTYYSLYNVANIKNVEVLSQEGLVITKDNEIVLDAYYGPSKTNGKIKKTGYISIRYHVQYMMGLIFKPKKIIDIDSAFIITTRWSENYYHWFSYVIPKIRLIEILGIKIENIVLNKMIYPFQRNSLNIFKDKFNFIETSRDYVIKVTDAFVPNAIAEGPQKCVYLNKLYLNNVHFNKIESKRIYISRSKSNSRRVINEIEVLELLKNYDFKVLYLEDLSFEEQVSIFQNSEIIVGPHGAGLNNIIFASKNTKVIEFLPYKDTKEFLHYFYFSAYLNLDYYVLVDRKPGKFRHKKDIHVDKSDLKQIIESLIQ